MDFAIKKEMEIESKDFAQVTSVEILSINEIPNENIATPNNNNNNHVELEIKSETKEFSTLKVPYILNGELYQILARNGENVTVKCCFCPAGQNRGIYRGSVRSTGNFHMHIKRRHPYLLGRLHEMKVHSLLERRDRLMKNRRAKLRRLSLNKHFSKGEQEVHKLKIKRAFQRHQAEAKGNNQNPAENSTTLIETSNEARNVKIPENGEPTHINESVSNSEILLTSNNAVIMTTENIYCDMRTRNNVQTMVTSEKRPISEPSTPAVTPYPSTYDGSTFGEFNPPTPAVHVEIEAEEVERPLDLSFNGANDVDSDTTANLSTYESSGIGLEHMWSGTTVANTVSTTISAIQSANNHETAAIFHNDGSITSWQQGLALTLRDIHNDIRIRNRIEHNRLLLEIAKLKFLHPGFYFNLQE